MNAEKCKPQHLLCPLPLSHTHVSSLPNHSAQDPGRAAAYEYDVPGAWTLETSFSFDSVSSVHDCDASRGRRGLHYPLAGRSWVASGPRGRRRSERHPPTVHVRDSRHSFLFETFETSSTAPTVVYQFVIPPGPP